jgi:hypothetical protein
MNYTILWCLLYNAYVESTELTKWFASQGIKLPMRKDTKGSRVDETDDD